MKLDVAQKGVLSRSLVILLATLLITVLLTGCAATSTTVVDEEVVNNPKPMASYKFLLVHEFDLKRDLYTNVPDARMDSREHHYAQVPSQLALQIQRYVKSKHIYQDVLLDGDVTDTTLILKGRFTKVGRFRISVEAVLQDGATGHEVAYFKETLWDVFDTMEGIGRLGREIADFIDRIQYK